MVSALVCGKIAAALAQNGGGGLREKFFEEEPPPPPPVCICLHAAMVGAKKAQIAFRGP